MSCRFPTLPNVVMCRKYPFLPCVDVEVGSALKSLCHKNTSHIFCTPTLKSAPFLLCLFGSFVSFSRRFLLKNIIFQWFFWLGWPGLRPGWLGLKPGWMAQRGGRTNKRTDRKSTHSTGLCPLFGLLPKNKAQTQGSWSMFLLRLTHTIMDQKPG